jgi:hypothetical protein
MIGNTINDRIDSIQQQDERNFLFGYIEGLKDVKVKDKFEPEELVDVVIETIRYLKTGDDTASQRLTRVDYLIKNAGWDKVQGYWFYRLMYNNIRNLVLPSKRTPMVAVLYQIDKRLKVLKQVVSAYEKYTVSRYVKRFKHYSNEELKKVITNAKTSYQQFISRYKLKDNGFVEQCDAFINELVTSELDQPISRRTTKRSGLTKKQPPVKTPKTEPHGNKKAKVKDTINQITAKPTRNIDTIQEQVDEEFGDIKLAVKMLGYTEQHVRKLCRENKLPHSKPNGQYRFERDELIDWIKNSKGAPNLKIGR